MEFRVHDKVRHINRGYVGEVIDVDRNNILPVMVRWDNGVANSHMENVLERVKEEKIMGEPKLKRVIEELRDSGLTNEQIGKDIGVAGSAIGKWQHGYAKPWDRNRKNLYKYYATRIPVSKAVRKRVRVINDDKKFCIMSGVIGFMCAVVFMMTVIGIVLICF